MYRAVALAALRAEADLDDERAVGEIAAGASIVPRGLQIELDGDDVSEEIREPRVSEVASRIAVHGAVRDAMVRLQREVVATGGWVCEGRDIGTVVCPDAPLKVFLVADPQERARRRAAESDDDVAAVLASMQERDARDRRRVHGALIRAADAVQLDTTGLGVTEVADRVVVLARERGFQ